MEDYSAKLTAEPFLYNETKIIAEYLLNGEDPNELKRRNIEENLIHHKKIGSVKRVNSPIFRRLSVLNKELLDDLVHSDIEIGSYFKSIKQHRKGRGVWIKSSIKRNI